MFFYLSERQRMINYHDDQINYQNYTRDELKDIKEKRYGDGFHIQRISRIKALYKMSLEELKEFSQSCEAKMSQFKDKKAKLAGNDIEDGKLEAEIIHLDWDCRQVKEIILDKEWDAKNSFPKRMQRFFSENISLIFYIIIVTAVIYAFKALNTNEESIAWLISTGNILIGISVINVAIVFFMQFTCKSGGCINGMMLFPAVILMPIGILMYIIGSIF